MDITDHGAENAHERTGLDPRTLFLILENLDKAGIKIGESKEKECEYWLFYSHADRRMKIAVVSMNRKCLISIWEGHFRLPDGIGPVTHEMVIAARTIFREFMFSRLKQANQKEKAVRQS